MTLEETKKRSLEERVTGQVGDQANFCPVLKSSVSAINS